MTAGILSVIRDVAPGTPHPHNLMLGDRLAQCITDHEATRIEAQIAGSSLRVVDVGGTGLPRWPDLTELRDAYNRMVLASDAHLDADMFEEETTGPALDDAGTEVMAAIRRLCYPDTATGSESK